MKLKIFPFFMALFVFLVWGCQGTAQIWKVNGNIDERFVKKFEYLSKLGVKNISVSSPGGDIEEALKVSKIIFENDIAIQVDGLCASACVNYIFLVSKNRSITSSSVLLIHDSVITFNEDIRSEGFVIDSKSASMEDYYRSLVAYLPDSEAVFEILEIAYQNIGVSDIAQTHCGKSLTKRGRSFCYIASVNNSYWVPSINQLNQIGLEFEYHAGEAGSKPNIEYLLSCVHLSDKNRWVIVGGARKLVGPQYCLTYRGNP